MSTLLVRHATVLVTQDAQRREIADGGLFARDGIIEQVGPTEALPTVADDVLDLDGHVVLPGLVNTHHHLYQTLTRAVPAAQDADLFHWLVTLYPIWARLTPEAVRVSTQIGLAELALSGCTTASDHLYIFPNGCRLDDEIDTLESMQQIAAIANIDQEPEVAAVRPQPLDLEKQLAFVDIESAHLPHTPAEQLRDQGSSDGAGRTSHGDDGIFEHAMYLVVRGVRSGDQATTNAPTCSRIREAESSSARSCSCI